MGERNLIHRTRRLPFPHSNPLIIGCRYKTTWQKHTTTTWWLDEVEGIRAKIRSNRGKAIWTNIQDLRWFKGLHNVNRAFYLLQDKSPQIVDLDINNYLLLQEFI